MNATEIYQSVGASVASLVVERGAERVSSGSGFIVSGRLVTAGHVVNFADGLSLRVKLEPTHGSVGVEWRHVNNGSPFEAFSDENSLDYAVLTVPDGIGVPVGLHWAAECPSPGEAVAVLGYPFEDPHLTIHVGYISASFQSGVSTMLKLDMSINPSNSGGPLIRMSDGAVLGVVTRKATGLTRSFDQLVQTMDENIRLLAAPRSDFVTMGGIDPIQAALITQRQMRHVAAEIYRSSNVGIGYAVWNKQLREEPCFDA